MDWKPTLLILTFTVLVAACGGGGGGPTNPPPQPAPNPPPPPTGGLDERPTNATCIAPSRTSGTLAIRLTPAFPSLPGFTQPIAALQRPGDDTRWYVVEQGGTVRAFDNDEAVSGSDLVVDISQRISSGGERGLLGMAFHPGFSSNGRVFLSYTDVVGDTVIAEFSSGDGGQTIDAASETILLRAAQDFSNHNGGNILFDADGYLYIGLGDGGSGGDPLDRGEDPTNILGALLRIDVDSGSPYGIPVDNPFAGNPLCPFDHSGNQNCPEIYAWGFRNPWRFSFDRATGDLWLGDVGQNQYEEVDLVERGGNYGWDCREGAHDFEPAGCPNDLIDPVAEYDHGEGNSITGGYVYRGSSIPGLVGRYLFGDFGSGRIWALSANGQGGYDRQELLATSANIASFAEDVAGELYVVSYGGELLRVEDDGSSVASGVANQLSAVGCFDSANPSDPGTGLIPYAPNAAFWSDGASKDRWIAVPDGQTIDIGADGDFLFPTGTVLAKHFRLNGSLVETRLFMRHPDGAWAGYSFEWNGAQDEATLVEQGKEVNIAGQDYVFPSSAQCLECHTEAAGYALGLETAQLNRDLTYPATGREANQLVTLDDIMMFTSPLSQEPDDLPRLVDPTDGTESLEDRARAYLHTNCSGCHRPGGGTPTTMDLRFSVELVDTGVCNVAPQLGDLGINNSLIVSPGDPDGSVLPARMDRRDVDGMPPVASNLVDSGGVTLIRDWISGLSDCS